LLDQYSQIHALARQALPSTILQGTHGPR